MASNVLISESFNDFKELSSYIKYNITDNLSDKDLINKSSNIISESTVNEENSVTNENYK